jgi:hypothetical protein
MSEVVRFFQTYENVIYFILGVGMIIYGWRLWMAWQEMREAIFGLERTSSQTRLRRSAINMIVLLMIGLFIFSVVTFVAPVIVTDVERPLPTPMLLLEPTEFAATTSAQEAELAAIATATPLPTVAVITEGCKEGSVDITSPKSGEAISGVVTITGSANVPDFGFYKFEVARADEELWLTVQAGRTVVKDGELVKSWDTSLFLPGEYVIQLVVTDNNGESLEPCRVPVRIGSPPEE